MDVKVEARLARSAVENVNTIMNVVKSDSHVSPCSTVKELKISLKGVWNRLNKAALALRMS